MESATGLRDTESAQLLKQLRQDSLRTYLVAVPLGTWLWVASVMVFDQQHTVHAWLVLCVILSISWISYLLREQHWTCALLVFIAGLIAATSLVAILFSSAMALYLHAMIVLVTASLVNPPTMLGVAILCVGLIPALAMQAGLHLSDTLLSILFTLIATVTAWLSSQHLHTALSWSLTMTTMAQRKAEEAQRHRGEVQRVLKSLDEAYVRLERAQEALTYAREAAERAYRFKTEFVTNVSHELRTPLNLIVGFSEMMTTAPESYGGVALPREYRGDVMAIYRSACHLSELINDVLDLSRIEAGRMPLAKEAADLGEVIREAAEMVRGLIEAHRLQLELDLPESFPMLRFDRTRVRQVLLNLLTNATRFTDTGWIRVSVRVKGSEAEVTVQDTGRGIAPEVLAKAFETFVQLDENHVREGSGLGLAVSKKFVELHGGRMWIESEVGRGTTVGFTLPIPKDEQQVVVSRLRVSMPLSDHRIQPRVLVLHDDPRAFTLLCRHLDGYQFVLAETLEQACAIIREDPPDVVITSAIWASHERITARQLELPSHVPFIVCPLPSLHRLGLILGAQSYLVKPVTREDLSQALSRLPRPPRTVLVVDDDPHVVRLLARMLKAINQHVRVLKAFNGQEGLRIAQSQQPDVVLLDLLMPEMNGYAFLEELTHNKVVAQPQVIIVSVKGVEQEAASIMGELRLERGAGFSITEILQILQAILSTATRAVVKSPTNVATLLEASTD
jgi:signal transduction histidine kinase/DNA-binding response OmpR family regulator